MNKPAVIKLLLKIMAELEISFQEIQDIAEPEPADPVGEDFAKGVQMQGVARFKTLGTRDPEEAVDLICESIKATKATVIRIPGGKNADGMYHIGPGTGSSKFGDPAGDFFNGTDVNHMQVYVAAAVRSKVPVIITLHSRFDKASFMEFSGWVKSTGVEVKAYAVGNEEYSPEDLSRVEGVVRGYPDIIAWIRESGFQGDILIPVLVGLNIGGREARAQEYNRLVDEVIDFSDPRICLDIHPYCPIAEYTDAFPGHTPTDYLDLFLEQLEDFYDSKIPIYVTEWARKKQAKYPVEEAILVIDHYMAYFRGNPRFKACCYNTMDGDRGRGLYDFDKKQLTPQGEFFAKI
nr:hypothetical protein [uncultured bacterium]